MKDYRGTSYKERKEHFLSRLNDGTHASICISPNSPEYVGMNTHMKFRCLAGLGHKDWDAVPASIIYQGSGCPMCDKSHKLSNEEFIKKVKNVHGNKVIPVETYIDAHTSIKFRCNAGLGHKDWKASPTGIMSGEGCPMCAGSKGEKILASIFETNHIDYDFQVLVYINGIRHLFDFSIKDSYGNITFIEIDGLQHKKSSKLWGGNKELENRKKRDKQKDLYAKEHNIRLIRIPQNNINLEFILGVVRNDLGFIHAQKPDINHIPLFMQYSNIANYYLSHSREETSVKFKVCQSTVMKYFKNIFGCSRREYLKQHPNVEYKMKSRGGVEIYGVDKIGNLLFAPNVAQASKYVGARGSGNISACIHGRKKSAYGYRWFYVE